MKRHTITIGSTCYVLGPGQAVEELLERMVDAVVGGGGFVDFTAYANRHVWVLVSPGLPVTFEEVEVEVDEEDTDSDADAPHAYTWDGFDL
jgi:hypothetical protein